ncbi:acetaldehyde dehydrogenase (acetylating) [Planomicrobium sp. YIM 101495]|uniref:acetaldehyde dehydrogenase (acetylating) n=1 Tax=Planomicrobium sp. YIM 101495 TaxID=2665160 RepID=UPI0012B95088|nr:acetaldehyde dehydrogenase (acetylating) [Planomicrobium sp. YIM 101495]MTD30671.1 acetaldehyde dehydrogenase (acetylating) [Planomicrobium sp. YIM 101495]
MVQQKVKCAIIGSGNIGTDLMYKLLRSETLEPTVMIGIDPNSKGLALAKEHGLTPVYNGIEGFKEIHEQADIVFEATSAKAHLENAKILKELGKKAIDLTPAAVGPFIIPAVNLESADITSLDNVNMVTCGGQATVPIVKAISDIVKVPYAEIVSSISSKSAGPGTRQNIDEFTVTTAKALREVGGAAESKTLIVLNPAEPPILMRNTIFVKIEEHSEEIHEQVKASIDDMIAKLQQYVPGYRYKSEPVFKEDTVTVQIEVEGMGDFLPKYAGNLDIITSAAIRTAELIAGSMAKEVQA